MGIQPFLGITPGGATWIKSGVASLRKFRCGIGGQKYVHHKTHTIRVLKNTASLPAAGVLGVQFLKFILEYLLWIRPFHTAENHYPAVCKTVTSTVRPNRSLFGIPISTSLMCM